MDPGLARLLELINSNPADTLLVDRYLVLAADLGEDPRADATLGLARALIAKNPRRAIELAHMVYQARPAATPAIEIMIEAFESLGRYGKATVLRYELEKMRGERVSPVSNLEVSASLAAAVDDSMFTLERELQFIGTEPSESKFLMDMPELQEISVEPEKPAPQIPDKKYEAPVLSSGIDELVFSAPVLPRLRNQELTVTHNPRPLLADVKKKAPETSVPFSFEMEPVPAMQQKQKVADAPTPILEPGFVPEQPEPPKQIVVPVSSPKPAPKPEPIAQSAPAPILKLDLSNPPSDEVSSRSKKPAVPAAKNGAEPKKYEGRLPGIPEAIPRDESQRASIPVQHKPKKELPKEPSPIRDLALVAELFDFYWKQGLYDEGRKILDRAQDSASGEAWYRARRALLERADKFAGEHPTKIEPQAAIQPVVGDSAKEVKGAAASAPLTMTMARARMRELIKGQDWEALWHLMERYFSDRPDSDVMRIAREAQVYKVDLRFTGWWMDMLIADGRALYALSFAVSLMREQPHIAWARMAYARIPTILKKLRLRRITWREQDGVGDLLLKLEMGRLRTPASVAIIF